MMKMMWTAEIQIIFEDMIVSVFVSTVMQSVPPSRINFWTNERQRTEFFKSVLWARQGNARQVPATLLLFLKLDFKPLLMYLSGACPSDSFDEALADMIHDSVDDLGKDLSRGHYEKDETKKVRFYSLTSIPGAGCSTRKRYFLGGLQTSGTHYPERATSMRLCHGVFTDQFIFRTVLARILNIF